MNIIIFVHQSSIKDNQFVHIQRRRKEKEKEKKIQKLKPNNKTDMEMEMDEMNFFESGKKDKTGFFDAKGR